MVFLIPSSIFDKQFYLYYTLGLEFCIAALYGMQEGNTL